MTTKPKNRLSIDELRSYTGFENYSDEMAGEILAGFEAISNLFCEHYQKQFNGKRY